MRAIVFDGTASKLSDNVVVREPGSGEVLVRIVASGLCQSDLSVMNGKIPFPVPVILGHEGAGVVEAVGPGVTAPAVGDHVVLSTLATCGHCAACVSGRPTMCRESYGAPQAPYSMDGGAIHNFAALSTFSEYALVKAVQAVSIPKDISLASACLIGCCVLTGAGAVLNRARIQVGDTVAVIGSGGIGLNVIQAARIAGATRIVAIDTNPTKEAQATRFGATDFINPTQVDTVAALRELTGGGANHVFDCVGGEKITSQAMDMLDWGGQLILLGVASRETKFSVPASTFYMDRSVLGCRYGSSRPAADIPRFIDLYRSGRLLLDELITKTYNLDTFDMLVDDAKNGLLDRGVLVMSS
ncbi:Zn-dependent alcohol dehydrogenase [Rhodococcus sovatensis]|uniref:Zn-dependent alcohol dehydrogenase n=1 Tax=Rhodococcus sovatensis TaxID=1805840 RepID=A0ABZ2PHR2_9NOCA